MTHALAQVANGDFALNSLPLRSLDFLEKMPDAAILADLQGQIVFSNAKADDLFGYPSSALIGKNISVLVPPDKRDIHQTHVGQYANSPTHRPLNSHLNLYGIAFSGTLIPLNIMLNPVQVEGKEYVLSVVRDISERLQQEEEFSTIINTALDGFWLVNRQGRFIRVNDAYCEMIGYSQAELLQMGINDIDAVESEDETKNRIEKIINIGSDRFETKHRRKSGDIIDVEVSARFLSDKDGGRFFVFLRDITKKTQAYSEVAQLNKLVLASSSIGFIGYEVDSGNCIMANEAAAFIVGAKKSDLLAQNFRQIPSWKSSGLLKMADKAILTGKEEITSNHFITTFGKDVFLHGTFNTFVKDGRLHLLFSFIDVTEREKTRRELFQAYDATIEGWSRALELRDPDTEGHTKRVATLTVQLARAMNISEDELTQMRRGALLHDIGKLAIPDRILQKPDKLNEEEWKVMQMHPAYAVEMLAPIAYLKPALDIPACHHEKWNGRGYPNGLKGENIPLAARIFAVIDVWDALRSNRPYRHSWPRDRAIAYIQENAGEHFDPEVVDNFLAQVNTGFLEAS